MKLTRKLKALSARVRAHAEAIPGRHYAQRHPSSAGVAITSAFRGVLGHLMPNDKWSLGVHLPLWLRALDIPTGEGKPAPKCIFMFCAYRIQFTLDFMVAILLAWRGHTITFGYLPKLQSPIKEPLADHASAKPYLTAVLAKVETWSRGRIRCVDLSDEDANCIPPDETFIRSQVQSDVVMCVKRETLDMDDPETFWRWTYYEEQARRAQCQAYAHFSRTAGSYDVALIANGTTFESAQFCRMAKKQGIPVNTFEKFAFRNVRVMNHGDDFRAFNDLDTAWNQRERLGYHCEPFYSFATSRALGLLNERRMASKKTWSWTLQVSPDQTADQALTAIGLAQGTPFILVCTNVPYDAGYDGLLGLFSSMREWLLETVRHLLENTCLHVVVRAHPGEAAHYGGKERSEETLAEFLSHPRLTMIPGEQSVNTYGLMESCKYGVAFSSTTGMEMVMMGKKVVVGANVYYGRKGFTVDSDTRDDYFANLTQLAAAQGEVGSSEHEQKQAALFHFLLHFIMQWPFPYDKPSCVQSLPPCRLLRSHRMSRYIPFLDALVLTADEWKEHCIRFIAADGSNHIPVADGPP